MADAAPVVAYTGLMCAFVCPQDVADKIATVASGLDLPEGAKLLDKSDYHITLTFTKADGIGEWPADSELPDGMPAEADVGDDPGYRAAAFADEVLTGLEPLHGTITGFWRFSPSTNTDNASVLVLLVDVLGLVQIRELIVDALEQAGLQVSDDFAFVPHITVAYVPGEGSAAAVDRAIHPGNALLAENGVGPLVLDTFEVAYAEEPPILFTLAEAQEAAVQASELASLMFADDSESDFDGDADAGYSQPGSAPGGSGGFPPYGSVAFGFAFNLTNPEAVKWIDEHATLLVKEITDQQMSIIRQYLHESFVDGITPAATARRIRDVVGLTSNQAAYVENYLQRLKAANVPDLVQQKLASQYAQRWLNFRANTIARTETIRAAISGQQELWEQALDAGLINTSSYEQTWIVTPDDRLCPACRPYRNLRAPLGGVFQGGVVGPPLHPQCLPDETLVSTSSRVLAVARRWYEGDMVILETSGNKKLSCTPNHPVLTPYGWVAAERLEMGNQLVCIDNAAENNDYQNMPTAIEQIVKAFGRVSTGTKVPVAVEDFHGDGGGSEVAVIWADSLLRNAHDRVRMENSVDALFHRPESASGLDAYSMPFQGFFRPLAAPACSMCSLRITDILFRGFPGGQQAVGLGLGSYRDIAFGQQPSNQPSRSAVLRGQSCFGSARDIFGNDIVSGERSDYGIEFFLAHKLGSFGLPRVDFSALDAFSSSSNGFGSTSTDTIQSVRRERFAGYVNNLETESGWYVAEGIVTHNCRCAIGLVLRDSTAAQKVVPPPYGGGNGKPMAPKIPTQYMMSEEARVPAGSSRGGQFLSGRVSGNIPGAEIHEEDFKKTLDEAVERVKALGVKADFAGLDPATARTISYRVVDMLKMFPGIKSVLGSIEAKDFRKTAPEGAGSPAVVSSTLATTFTGKRTLRLNTAVLGLDGINSHTERSDAGAAAGWNAGGSGPVRRVVEHEFGHLAQYALEKNAAAVVSEFYRAYLPEMSSISRYASSRPEEAWAEAFCESFGHAPPVSQRLRQVVESHLSK